MMMRTLIKSVMVALALLAPGCPAKKPVVETLQLPEPSPAIDEVVAAFEAGDTEALYDALVGVYAEAGLVVAPELILR
ncbi:MAG: hypothetical protein HN348_16155, partial [Proteobacteria bacterium]|nr:hypothetical protein [Pseudomonadota bacterium]